MNPILHITQYCERGADPALIAEPFNALSNLAFFLVAFAAFAKLPATAAGVDTRAERALIALVTLVGIGSTLFHTFATPWAMAADVVPIGAFVLAYAILASRRFLSLSWGETSIGMTLLVASQAAAGLMRCNGGPCLNGSTGYVPALCLLVAVAIATLKTCPKAAPRLFAAAAVFALALTLRSLDLILCDTIVIFGKTRGTHALWHLLNAATIALLLDAAIKTAPVYLKDCAPRQLVP